MADEESVTAFRSKETGKVEVILRNGEDVAIASFGDQAALQLVLDLLAALKS